MFIKSLVTFIFFFTFFLNLHSSEKQSIIDRLSEIENFSFNFEQTTTKKIETGKCLLVFDKKLKCSYNDELKKEIIINNKTLAIIKQKYDGIYLYPVSKSPFLKILNKDSLINLIRDSNVELNKNIDLVHLDANGEKITVFFNKKNYELLGWKVEDQFRNEIYFSLKIQMMNTEIDNKIFKIPSNN